jgi:transposase
MFFIGIDVSKAKLYCSLLLDVANGKRKSKSVANSKAGITDLLSWCIKQAVVATDLHAILEGTGVYHEQAALALFDAGVTVAIVNPAFMPLGCRLKTLVAVWVSALKPTTLTA